VTVRQFAPSPPRPIDTYTQRILHTPPASPSPPTLAVPTTPTVKSLSAPYHNPTSCPSPPAKTIMSNLQNLSVHADSLISYRWIFNQIDTLFANSPIRQFANSGPQSIQLTPFDIHGCNASITKTLHRPPHTSGRLHLYHQLRR